MEINILTLVPNSKSKRNNKKYEELWCKIRDLIRSIIISSDDYDKKIYENKSDNELPLNKR